MTKPFLRQVAEQYIKEGFGERIFVFPNRRSIVFFRKHISDIIRQRSLPPILGPRMMSVSDFFCLMAGERTSDRLSLLMKLYDCYSSLINKKEEETLDDFVYWGDTILSDFDDIDKYLIDAGDLFANIKDLKALSDDYSYLSRGQIEAIKKLADHFTPANHPENKTSRVDVKDRFLGIWEIMLDLYRSFKAELSEAGLAYEGMIYRNLAESISKDGAEDTLRRISPDLAGCVFIGLNVLTESEKKILSAFHRAGLAEFCWDFSSEMLKDLNNNASYFMRDNLQRFPQKMDFDPEPLPKPRVHVVKVPSATGQAKLLPDILSRIDRKERGIDTAVVLPDEGLLSPVLSSLPASLEIVNVTMGYPLSSSEWNALMQSIMALQIHSRDQKYFYHKQVYDIFSSGIITSVLSDKEKETITRIHTQAKAYIPATDLNGCGDVFQAIFQIRTRSMAEASAAQCKDLEDYLINVIETVASHLDKDTDALHLECAFKYLSGVRSLSNYDLAITPRTLIHLIGQFISKMSVPFAGEPLGGLQIMGPLETRALDFKHLVIMNANEDIFPSKSSSPSIIPPELRGAFGLPNYDLQDKIWAYYFYRMISRSEDVWMIYDSRTEGITTGEESRYIKQLRYLYSDRCILDESVASCDISGSAEDVIVKTEEDIEKIKKLSFSATTIHKYLTCPASFYYHAVKELYSQDEVKEDLDSGMLGTVCHDTLQAIYCSEEAMDPDIGFDKTRQDKVNEKVIGVVTEGFLKHWLSEEGKERIKAKVMGLICLHLHCERVEGRNLVAADIAVRYVTGVLRADLKFLKKHGSMRIIALEKKCIGVIKDHNFKGYIDRLDTFEDGTIRVVDYKTGSDRQDVLNQEDDKHVEKMFGKDHGTNKAGFQFFVYDKLLQGYKEGKARTILNVMYPMTEVFTTDIQEYPMIGSTIDAIEERLGEVLAEMEDRSIPFEKRSGDNCKHCDFAALCGVIRTE